MHTEILIVGGGPAGTATGILLANAGLRVVLVEQQAFPRQKVCGECLSAGALTLLDELGIGQEICVIAGPEIRQVGWMGSTKTLVAPFPRCTVGAHAYGRPIGRDSLDSLLMARARRCGVEVIQPARVRRVIGTPGHFVCDIETRDNSRLSQSSRSFITQVWTAKVVIDAHGSWKPSVTAAEGEASGKMNREAVRDSDLFAFKATFTGASLPAGLLPVIAFPGGYGGIVVTGDGQTTLACCIRRDALRASREVMPGRPAGLAVEMTLRRSCRGVAQALSRAQKEIAWLCVGPIRPGIRVDACKHIFRVGNAAGEVHPLIGEGINMALHSARLAAAHVSRLGASVVSASQLHVANRAYAAEWRAAFGSRLRYATWYAHMAMRPAIAHPLHAILQATPSLMTHAARWAGKARGGASHRPGMNHP